jgi:radical SAM-linked protein
MRVRARFTKQGKVRFTSHRDVARLWERALRKASVPVAYTAGFSPRPRLHFGLALSTGHESLAEYLDIDLDGERLDGPVDLEKLAVQLSNALPEGILVTVAAEADRSADSLQQAVTSCTWSIVVGGATRAALARRIEQVLDTPSLPVTRERKGRQVSDDLRPHLVSLQLTDAEHDTCVLEAELGTQPRSVRPTELVAALSPEWTELRVCRLQQWISHDGDRHEPLVPWRTEPSWAPTEVRAP